MKYTVKKLANLVGISSRTLHYYDEVGLLKPSDYGKNGYRLYQEEDLLRLQQILFYRELELSLDEIKAILNSPHFDVIEALEDHKSVINLKIKGFSEILHTIDKTIKKVKGEIKMKDQELYGAFSKEQVERYKKEIKEKYSSTFVAEGDKTKKWTKEEFKAITAEGEDITKSILDKINQGLEPEDNEVQIEIERHFQLINKFYDCSLEIYEGLANVYAEDERFVKVFEKQDKMLPEFMRKAMILYCQSHKS